MLYYLTNLWDFLFFHIPRFIRNLWKFRKVIYNHYPYDYHSTLYFLQIALKDISDYCEKYGLEVDESRSKKVNKMRRAVKIIENINEDEYQELAEKELEMQFSNDSEINGKIIQRAIELEKKEWNELMEILKGQEYSLFDKNKDFYEQFDGSGLKTWWD